MTSATDSDINNTNNEQEGLIFPISTDDINYDNVDILRSDSASTAKKVYQPNKKRTRESTSFVWSYFKKGENQISATCCVIKEDGTECGHCYNDGSTTSNLIHHLAIKHNIYKSGSAKEVILLILYILKQNLLLLYENTNKFI